MPSTVIAHFTYDTSTGMLKITFLSGSVYAYHDVPDKIYQGLSRAASKGKYFNRLIKNHYNFDQLVQGEQN